MKDIRSCSLTVIKLPGGPKSVLTQFGAPENLTKGASYATYVAVYPDETAAAKGFDTVRKAVTKCSKKHLVPSKTLPNRQYTLAHRDSWTLTEDSVAEWTHLRGTEKNDYSASLSKLGVFYLMHDYALRGNVIFTSTYWQRLDPGQSSKAIEKRATEVLTKQLEKIG